MARKLVDILNDILHTPIGQEHSVDGVLGFRRLGARQVCALKYDDNGNGVVYAERPFGSLHHVTGRTSARDNPTRQRTSTATLLPGMHAYKVTLSPDMKRFVKKLPQDTPRTFRFTGAGNTASASAVS